MEQFLENRLSMRNYFTNCFVTEESYEAFILHTVLFVQSYIFAKLLAFLNIVNATRVQRYA